MGMLFSLNNAGRHRIAHGCICQGFGGSDCGGPGGRWMDVWAMVKGEFGRMLCGSGGYHRFPPQATPTYNQDNKRAPVTQHTISDWLL